MSKKFYVNDTELLYHIILSKGRGKRTPELERMIILIAQRVIRKKINSYRNQDDMNDCLQHSILHTLVAYKNFNENKYSVAVPYITELVKRSLAEAYNIINNKKSYYEHAPKMISIDRYMGWNQEN